MANGLSGVAGQISAPSIPASGSSYINITGRHCLVTISGGTITSISVGGNVLSGILGGLILIPANSEVSIVYAVAPTWSWFAL